MDRLSVRPRPSLPGRLSATSPIPPATSVGPGAVFPTVVEEPTTPTEDEGVGGGDRGGGGYATSHYLTASENGGEVRRASQLCRRRLPLLSTTADNNGGSNRSSLSFDSGISCLLSSGSTSASLSPPPVRRKDSANYQDDGLLDNNDSGNIRSVRDYGNTHGYETSDGGTTYSSRGYPHPPTSSGTYAGNYLSTNTPSPSPRSPNRGSFQRSFSSTVSGAAASSSSVVAASATHTPSPISPTMKHHRFSMLNSRRYSDNADTAPLSACSPTRTLFSPVNFSSCSSSHMTNSKSTPNSTKSSPGQRRSHSPTNCVSLALSNDSDTSPPNVSTPSSPSARGIGSPPVFRSSTRRMLPDPPTSRLGNGYARDSAPSRFLSCSTSPSTTSSSACSTSNGSGNYHRSSYASHHLSAGIERWQYTSPSDSFSDSGVHTRSTASDLSSSNHQQHLYTPSSDVATACGGGDSPCFARRHNWRRSGCLGNTASLDLDSDWRSHPATRESSHHLKEDSSSRTNASSSSLSTSASASYNHYYRPSRFGSVREGIPSSSPAHSSSHYYNGSGRDGAFSSAHQSHRVHFDASATDHYASTSPYVRQQQQQQQQQPQQQLQQHRSSFSARSDHHLSLVTEDMTSPSSSCPHVPPPVMSSMSTPPTPSPMMPSSTVRQLRATCSVQSHYSPSRGEVCTPELPSDAPSPITKASSSLDVPKLRDLKSHSFPPPWARQQSRGSTEEEEDTASDDDDGDDDRQSARSSSDGAAEQQQLESGSTQPAALASPPSHPSQSSSATVEDKRMRWIMHSQTISQSRYVVLVP